MLRCSVNLHAHARVKVGPTNAKKNAYPGFEQAGGMVASGRHHDKVCDVRSELWDGSSMFVTVNSCDTLRALVMHVADDVVEIGQNLATGKIIFKRSRGPPRLLGTGHT